MHIPLKKILPALRRQAVLHRLLPAANSEFRFRANRFLTRRAFVGKHLPGMRASEATVPRADGSGLLRLCIYHSETPKSGVPGLLWLHGGGFAMGCPEQEEVLIRQFIDCCGCTVVSPDYRLSIDAPYPAALLDCYDALRYLRDHADSLGVRSDQLFVAGGSGGGGLAAALTLYARDLGEIAVAFQMPWYPMLDDRMLTPSSQHNDDPIWSSKANRAAWQCYLGPLFCTDDVPIYAAPARATDLSGLPPTLTFVGDLEPFYDEVCAYAQRLSDCGVPVRFRVFTGCYHAFSFTVPNAAVSLEAVAFYLSGLADAAWHCFAPQPKMADRRPAATDG